MRTTTTHNETNHSTYRPTSQPVTYQQSLAAPLTSEDAKMLADAVLNSPHDAHTLESARNAKEVQADTQAEPCTGKTAGRESEPKSVMPERASAAATPKPAASAPAHRTYLDCLMGRANTPTHGPGKGAFQLLMVGGMVSFMATLNGVLNSGLAFFATAHWMYPLVFCIAFLMRLYVGDRVVGFVAPRYVLPRFRGLARSVMMTLLNVAVMGAIMGSAITLLLNGPAGFWGQLASTLPVTMAVAALVNFFVVGPAVKMIYNNVLEPTDGLGLFSLAQRYVMPWTAIFGN